MTYLRNIALAAGALALIGVGVVATTDKGFASDRGGKGYMCEQSNGDCFHRTSGHDHRGKGRGHGRGPDHAAMRMLKRFDVNGDRQITQAEIESVQAERFLSGDQDGNTTISLEEFQMIWMKEAREIMVDRFQALDADGDGAVTADEFNARVAKAMGFLDRNGDGVLNADDRPDRGKWGRGGPRHHNNGDTDN